MESRGRSLGSLGTPYIACDTAVLILNDSSYADLHACELEFWVYGEIL